MLGSNGRIVHKRRRRTTELTDISDLTAKLGVILYACTALRQRVSSPICCARWNPAPAT
jgi:hypothetical protein